MGKMFVLDSRGHGLSIKWRQGNAQEEAAARETFNDWRTRGYALFAMTADDQQGERVREFDPSLPGILAVPPLRGG